MGMGAVLVTPKIIGRLGIKALSQQSLGEVVIKILPKQPPQPLASRLRQHLHHLLRFAELFDQAVHILHFHA